MPISVIGPDKLGRSLADALAANRAGRLDEAEAIYRRIQAAAPDSADAHHLGALVAYQKGDAERARAGILRAIELAPDQVIYHANLARICRALGRPEEAVAAGESAVRLDPGNAEAHSDLAGVLVALGRMPEATEGRFSKHFTKLSGDAANAADLTPLADYLAMAAADRAGKSPFIWVAGKNGKPHEKLHVGAAIVLSCEERLDFWRLLQDLAGVK